MQLSGVTSIAWRSNRESCRTWRQGTLTGWTTATEIQHEHVDITWEMFAAASVSSSSDSDSDIPRELIWLSSFKLELRENSKLLLLHRGHRHLESDITEVLYSSYKEGTCPHCGWDPVNSTSFAPKTMSSSSYGCGAVAQRTILPRTWTPSRVWRDYEHIFSPALRKAGHGKEEY